MSRGVVCISRILGAGGREVGRLVATELGYLHVDEEIVQRAAESEGLSVDQLGDVERRTTFMDRLLRQLTLAGSATAYMSGVSELATPLGGTIERGSLRALIRKSIEETADRGNVVIVSHAASYALAGRSDVLRVLVTASAATRVARAAAAQAVGDKQAAKMVNEDDAGRAAYLHDFYRVDTELPTHYDLAINSDYLSTALIAELIVRGDLGRLTLAQLTASRVDTSPQTTGGQPPHRHTATPGPRRRAGVRALADPRELRRGLRINRPHLR